MGQFPAFSPVADGAEAGGLHLKVSVAWNVDYRNDVSPDVVYIQTCVFDQAPDPLGEVGWGEHHRLIF